MQEPLHLSTTVTTVSRRHVKLYDCSQRSTISLSAQARVHDSRKKNPRGKICAYTRDINI